MARVATINLVRVATVVALVGFFLVWRSYVIHSGTETHTYHLSGAAIGFSNTQTKISIGVAFAATLAAFFGALIQPGESDPQNRLAFAIALIGSLIAWLCSILGVASWKDTLGAGVVIEEHGYPITLIALAIAAGASGISLIGKAAVIRRPS